MPAASPPLPRKAKKPANKMPAQGRDHRRKKKKKSKGKCCGCGYLVAGLFVIFLLLVSSGLFWLEFEIEQSRMQAPTHPAAAAAEAQLGATLVLVRDEVVHRHLRGGHWPLPRPRGRQHADRHARAWPLAASRVTANMNSAPRLPRAARRACRVPRAALATRSSQLAAGSVQRVRVGSWSLES